MKKDLPLQPPDASTYSDARRSSSAMRPTREVASGDSSFDGAPTHGDGSAASGSAEEACENGRKTTAPEDDLEPLLTRNDDGGGAGAIPSAAAIVIVNLLMLFSMSLYAGNYVAFRVFNERGGTAFSFSFIRTLLSLPFLPIIIFFDPKNIKRRKESREAQLKFEETEGVERNLEDATDEKKVHKANSRRVVQSSRRHWADALFNFPAAGVFPLMVASLFGAIRQMLVPIALMFTTAENAGIIQPSVPVFTAVLAILLGLEQFSWRAVCSVLLSCVGLILSGRVWEKEVDYGFYILLGVPISKGLQVIGIQLASKHMENWVVQVWQIVGLLVVVVPVSLLGEMGIYCRWNVDCAFTKMFSLDATQWGSIVYSTVAIIVICWRIQILGVEFLGPVGVALYQACQPVFAFALGHCVLGEKIQAIQVVGAVVVCISLFAYQGNNLWKAYESVKARRRGLTSIAAGRNAIADCSGLCTEANSPSSVCGGNERSDAGGDLVAQLLPLPEEEDNEKFAGSLDARES